MEKQSSIPELSVQSITTEMLLKSLDVDPYDEDQVQISSTFSLFNVYVLLWHVHQETSDNGT